MRHVLVPLAMGPFVACLYYPDVGDLSGSGSSTIDAAAADAPKDSLASSDAADAGRFCLTGAHAFCADFDDGSVSAGWSDLQLDFGGTITPSTTRFVSPSFSAAVKMPRRAVSDPISYVTMNKLFSGWAHIVVDFDVYIEAPSWITGDVNSGIVSLFFYSDGLDKGISVSCGKDYTTIGTPAGQLNGGAMPSDRWFHVHFDVDPSKGTKATIDGQAYNDAWSASPSANPTTRIAVGVSGYNQPAPEFRINYDNVTVDFP